MMVRLFIHFGALSSLRQECIESQHKYYGDPDIVINESNIDRYKSEIKILYNFPLTTLYNKVMVSDCLRFYFASKIKDLLWMDTDIKIFRSINFAKGRDKMWHPEYKKVHIDYCYFYVNGNTDFYKAGFNWFCKHSNETMPMVDFMNLMRGRMRNFNRIPLDSFSHLSYDPQNKEERWRDSILQRAI